MWRGGGRTREGISPCCSERGLLEGEWVSELHLAPTLGLVVKWFFPKFKICKSVPNDKSLMKDLEKIF